MRPARHSAPASAATRGRSSGHDRRPWIIPFGDTPLALLAPALGRLFLPRRLEHLRDCPLVEFGIRLAASSHQLELVITEIGDQRQLKERSHHSIIGHLAARTVLALCFSS